MLELRPYQLDLLAKAREAMRRGVRSILIQSPTGSGKTCLVAHILKSCRQRGWPCWFVVHRNELVSQSVDTLTLAAGIPVGVAAAGHPLNPWELVQVCMVQSLRTRMARMATPRLIVVDECHHIASKTYRSIIEAYPHAILVGVTATPERLDGTGLGAWFKELIIGPSVSGLIAEGFLSRYRMFGARTLDLGSVHTQAGDYNRKELSDAMLRSAVVGDAIVEYRKHADGKRALAFTWSLESSQALADKFRAAGISAAHVDGKTPEPERLQMFRDFSAGQLKVLSNVDIAGEGVDVPACEAGFFLRPTQSLSLCLQQWGRLLRPAPGKSAALIFDHAGNRVRHGLPDDERIWTLDGSRPKSAGDYVSPQKQCMKCYSIQPAAAEKCRNCDTEFPNKSREVEEEAGELQELSPEEIARNRKVERARAETLEDLRMIEKQRGYKAGWARHVYEGRQAKRIPAMFAGGETK